MTKDKIPVLFLIMEFAPVNTTGNFRTLKFIKYLPELGIDPIVVTFKAEEASKIFNAPIDTGLLKEIPESVHVYRISCKPKPSPVFPKLQDFLSIYFSIQEPIAKWWWPFLKEAIAPIIERHRPAMIYTSLPPFCSGALAVKLSQKYNLPLVTDMRDLWAYWGIGPHKSRLHYWLTKRQEEKIFSRAEAVVAVTPPMIKTLSRIHSSVQSSKFKYIPNGFDKDVKGLQRFSFQPGPRKIIIGYVGSFYYEPEHRKNTFTKWWQKKPHKFIEYAPVKFDWLYRSPYFFLKTVAFVKQRYPEIGDLIQIEFVGKKPTWLTEMVEEFGLTSNFHSHGFVDYERSVKLQERFDLLLATSEKVLGEEHFCLPSKVFDYVGTAKPIIGFVTEGIQKEFITKSGLGVICDPDNIPSAATTIVDLIKKGKTFTPDTNYLSSFMRQNLAHELAIVLHDVAKQPATDFLPQTA
jgi:hypothetical protein